jgi:transcription elongation factor Elf1
MGLLICSNCGNTKTWKKIVGSRNGVSRATCAVCDHVTESSGGIEVDTVVGQRTSVGEWIDIATKQR